MNELTYVKQCECKATATTGRIVLSREVIERDIVKIASTRHPGPVCDACDTPWKIKQETPAFEAVRHGERCDVCGNSACECLPSEKDLAHGTQEEE